MTDVLYPQIRVQLTGADGNAFAVLGKVQRALREGGVSREKINAYMDVAIEGDYDHLLQTCMKWVSVE